MSADVRAELLALGLTVEHLDTVTGFGLRRLPGCDPTDTILNKYRAGALSRHGVMAVLFGTDSPQHHRGDNLGDPPVRQP